MDPIADDSANAPQDTTASSTLFGFGAGTVLMAILLPELTLPYLAAAAIVGGGTGAAVGYGVGSADDGITNFFTQSPVKAGLVLVIGLAAVGAGLYIAHKYA